MAGAYRRTMGPADTDRNRQLARSSDWGQASARHSTTFISAGAPQPVRDPGVERLPLTIVARCRRRVRTAAEVRLLGVRADPVRLGAGVPGRLDPVRGVGRRRVAVELLALLPAG